MSTHTTETTTQATHAWVSLTRLGGVNLKIEIQRRGKSVYVGKPQQDHGAVYRINAAKFDAGEAQFRDSWVIQPWGEDAERRAASEANWQT